MKTPSWHHLSFKKTLEWLKSSQDGLSQQEAEKRLQKYGFNELAREDKFRTLKIFFRQFKGLFTIFLSVAGGVSFLIGEKIDALIIFASVGLNVIFGFFQEYKAERIFSSLKKHIVEKIHVLRDAREQTIAVKFLVPGDIVFLKQGDKVPADIRLGYAEELIVNESILTGESIPVRKQINPVNPNAILAERRNMVYQGTLIVKGEAKGVVVATGRQTELGKISVGLVKKKQEPTPFEKRIKHLTKLISILVLAAFVFILIDGFIRESSQIGEIFITAVAVAVSAIPEGLIVAVTVILAIGMRRLSKKKAYLRRLASVETLGSVNLILTDKTGTLTQAKMVVDGIFAVNDSVECTRLINQALILANSARVENPKDSFANWHYVGSPTECALLKKALGEEKKELYLKRENSILDAVLFDSLTKYQARLIEGKQQNFLYIVGAPEEILKRASYQKTGKGKLRLRGPTLKKITAHATHFARQGLRVLAVAYKEAPKTVQKINQDDIRELIFLGFVTLKDPLRKNVRQTLHLTKKAGIKTVIVTGDHALTAKAIAHDLGIQVGSDQILAGDEITRLSEPELESRLKDVLIFARVSPYDKVRILKAYQKQGAVVAMTGDGINDALALKEADIGVALGSGQEVAKEAADLVLLNNDFSNIIAAVRYGRIIIENIKKVIVYLLSDSFSEVILVGGSILLGMPLPILPAQILWVNLLEDGLPSFALSFEKGNKGLMRRLPQKNVFFDREMKFIVFVVGIIVDLLLFSLFLYLMRQGRDMTYVRTMMFGGLSIDTFFIAFLVKNLRKPLFKTNLFDNPYLLGALAISLGMLLLAIYNPWLQNLLRLTSLNLIDWGIILSLGVAKLIGVESVKWASKKHFRLLKT